MKIYRYERQFKKDKFDCGKEPLKIIYKKNATKDVKNGIQNFCAVESKHEIIVTRNTKDFKSSKLSILNPKEYFAKLRVWL